MSMPRDVLRELAQLVRFVEPHGTNIGQFVAEHAGALARLLPCAESELVAATHERDAELADRLRARLERALVKAQQERHSRDVERAHRAAAELARTARWFERGVVLDVDVLLGAVANGAVAKHVALALPDATLVFEAALLRRARILLRTFLDVAVFVDAEALHFRWKAGRGVINTKSQVVSAAQMRAALVVVIPPPMRPPMHAFVGSSLSPYEAAAPSSAPQGTSCS
jgi:hypothetical protein